MKLESGPGRGLRGSIQRHVASRRGGVDLPSIMIGVAVVAILTGGILATVFGAIPWAQDNAAKQNVVAVRTAQGVAANTTGSFQDTAGLNKAGFLESTAGIGIATNGKPGEKGCFVTVMQSKSGKMFYGTDTMTEAAQLKDGTKDPCVLGAKLQDAIDEAGGKVVAGKDTYSVFKVGGGDLWDAAGLPTASSTSLAQVPGLGGKAVTDVMVASSHSCVVADGAPWCWGLREGYRFGDGVLKGGIENTPQKGSTTPLAPGAKMHDISGTYGTTCGVAAQKVYCWGNNANGQITPAAVTAHTASTTEVPGMVGKKISDASSGHWSTCAVSDGALWCWGRDTGGVNANGKDGSAISQAAKVGGVLANKTVTAVDLNGNAGCAVADNALYCWGEGGSGQLTSAHSRSLVPVKIPGLPKGKIQSISAGQAAHCAVIDANLWCWGSNANGEVGNGTFAKVTKPHLVKGALQGKSVESLETGMNFTCAIASGEAYCWGLNDYGQLGNGTKVNANLPVRVAIPAGQKAIQIAAGKFSMAVVTVAK